MFGQHSDHDDNHIPDHSIDGVISDEPASPTPPPAQVWPHPGKPLGDNPVNDDTISPVPTDKTNDSASAPTSDDTPSPSPTVVAPSTSSASADDAIDDITPDELLGIKRQVLTQLSPLVDHLDQMPEERFRTLMMMIQASDDQALVKSAYEAAKKITDEKARAQALLDIVNEINYFTQHQDGKS